MLPTTHGASGRAVKHGTFEVSTQATNQAFVDGVNGPTGGCRKRGRRGRVASTLREGVDEGEAMPPQPQADDLETLVARLQETVKRLVGMVKAQNVKINQQSEMITSLANQVVQQAEVGERDSDVSVHDFVKLKPPVFAGTEQEDPLTFINHMERIFEALGFSSQRSVKFAALQLHDVAATWYDFHLDGRSAGLPSLTWDKFKEAFMARFYQSRDREFERLRQTPSLSVSEYDVRFTQLSRYAPNHIPTERDKITRFVLGLDPLLFEAVGAAIDEFPSYVAAVDCARRIEMREMEYNSSPRMEQGSVGKSAQCGSVQMGRVRNPCTTCGKHHIGQCYKVSGACFQCGQVGHFKRDCPQLQSESSLGSF